MLLAPFPAAAAQTSRAELFVGAIVIAHCVASSATGAARPRASCSAAPQPAVTLVPATGATGSTVLVATVTY